jgi:conjugative relaxase-like TrwC/TraI family protein
MASRPKAISASHSQQYYYDKDVIHDHNSQWLGKGAEREGLSGEVAQSDLARIAFGFDKEGNPQFANKHQDSAFIDIPLNAPKEFSLLATVDKDLDGAMDRAMAKTASWLDENYAKCRVTENGKTKVQDGDGLIIASFKHGTSRENDPNTHAHLLVANQTKADNGKMYSLDARDIYKDQQLITATFTSFLAQETKELGYGITPKGNSFSIDEVPKDLCDLFSKRSTQIKALDSEYRERYPQITPGKRHDMAVRGSRHAKNPDLNKNELLQGWKEQASILGYALDQTLVDKAKSVEKTVSELTPADHVCVSAIIQTIDKPVVAKSALLCGALEVGRGDTNISDVVNATKELTKSGELVKCSNDGLTTKQTFKQNPSVEKSFSKSKNNSWGKKYQPVQYQPAKHKDEPLWVNPETKAVHFEPQKHSIKRTQYNRRTKTTNVVKQVIGGKNHGDVITTRLTGKGIERQSVGTTKKQDGTIVKSFETTRRSGAIQSKEKVEFFKMADGSKAKAVSESFFSGTKASGKTTMFYENGKIETRTWSGSVGVFNKQLTIDKNEKTVSMDVKKAYQEVNSKSQRTFNAVASALMNSAEVIGKTVSNALGLIKSGFCGSISVQSISDGKNTTHVVSKNHEPQGELKLPKGFEPKLDIKQVQEKPAPRLVKDKMANIEKQVEKVPQKQKEREKDKSQGMSL